MMKVEAVFRLDKEVYGDRKRTTIVISDEGEAVSIGVKTIGRVFSKDSDGNLCVSQKQYGDVDSLDKSEPISRFFDKMKELMDSLPEIVDETCDKA